MSLFQYEYSAFDFPEDSEEENGNYENRCMECGNLFIGNKHRYLCKKCDDKVMKEIGALDE